MLCGLPRAEEHAAGLLTAYSYERLNTLHQIAGIATFILLVLHAGTYTAFFVSKGAIQILREPEQTAGIVAAFGMLVLASSAILIRRFAYETFYVMHIFGFLAVVIGVGFHRPIVAEKATIVICVTAAMWATDRLIRATRFLLNTSGNSATVYPLPNGGTRIVLAKKPALVAPGKHVFLWIPKIRLFEMHPFTIISTQPLEFVVKEYNGFTKALHAHAVANPGATLRAACEGPYGTFPDPMQYDKIVLVAGGQRRQLHVWPRRKPAREDGPRLYQEHCLYLDGLDPR